RIYWANFFPADSSTTISYANLDGSGGGGELNLSGTTPNGAVFSSLLRAPGAACPPTLTRGPTPYAPLHGSRRPGDTDRPLRPPPKRRALPVPSSRPCRRGRAVDHRRLDTGVGALVLAGLLGCGPARRLPLPDPAELLLPVEPQRRRHQRCDGELLHRER